MIRFLNSIGINNIDDFDMSFELVGRNRFKKEQIDMVIAKTHPWNYDLWCQFQMALMSITYPYNLRFSYINKPTSDNVIQLLSDWYMSLYHLPISLNIKIIDIEHIEVVFADEKEANQFESIIKDFKDFLNFISYDFITVTTSIEEKEEIVEATEEEKTEALEKAEVVATEEIIQSTQESDVVDRNEALDRIEEEMNEKNRIVEDALLKEMKRNRELMEKERKRMLLNKRGNYTYVERIADINGESGNVDFNCTVYKREIVERGERIRINFGGVDKYGDAISCFAFQNNQISSETANKMLKSNVRVRGHAHIDDFTGQLMVKVHNVDLLPPDDIIPDEGETRVELHLHSNMSTHDGVTSMEDYCRYAKALGHKVISITDHGCVQSFPDAQAAADKTKLKMLYGCEFYMVDSNIEFVFNPKDVILEKASYVVFDLETTGLSARYDKIIEFGAIKITGGRVSDRIDILVNPECHIPEKITEITNITDEMVANEKTIDEVLPRIMEFIGDSILVTHNASFDFSFLNEALVNNGFERLNNPVIDTLAISRYLYPENRNHRLGTLCRHMEVKYDEDSAHRADYDAFVLSEVWLNMMSLLTKGNLNLTHKDLATLEISKETIMHLRPYHVIAFAKNYEGLKDLYKLVSISNIEYFSFVNSLPLITKDEIIKHRKNLLIGSACFNGEVYQTERYYNEETLKKVISFYDYIEVQPPANYSHLVNMGDIEEKDVNRNIIDIINAAKAMNKLVVATGDVHYLTPKEKIFRDVYIAAMQVGNIPHPLNPFNRSRLPRFDNPDQHYRSTKEMMECFSFLKEELAKEIVITNTNKIADMIEELMPVPNNKLYTPKIDNCENMLKDLCFSTAHKLYGDPLPEFIQNRLDTELNGIISNGYSVIYYIAHKLVQKSNEDGYIVGSRGSVGSSFVATMSGITEVNPLPPHYLCPHCHHLEWGKDEHPEIRSGFDLPNKKCPICGEEMTRDGQNIPFETFLGFHADKVPDIDLNFPGDYQSKAHSYTKVLLGKDNVYRAGTIETVAEKTAYGFARGYLEKSGIDLATYPKAKIDYLASGCVGVKRTTGQHPGGIVVIPNDHEVYDFTPIQWPADEVGSEWKTTHFDFHSIHDTILKLDMLGHVDPVALKMMCDLTHINYKDIPMNDKEVLSIFSNTNALKMKRNYLNVETGALAIPEFGTSFVRGILEDTRPKTFSDLVIISGLSHGTNVWNGNAEKLIASKRATLQEVIGCRDDIMTYLIDKGISPGTSFAIMESVRKGKGLQPEYEEVMKTHNVPDYYIDSCKKIKYLFPKGHAVAYVTMAVRVGYFKVHYPLEFYATFFSKRSKQYDIIPMIQGEDAIVARLDQLKNKEKLVGEKLSPKEEEQIKTLQVALEMVERGYSFSNIDLYKSDAEDFVVDHEHKCLIPPFITIDGLGANNAITVIEARKERSFSSKEDLLRRTKLTSTNVEDLSAMGVLESLSENDQLSLFDFGDF